MNAIPHIPNVNAPHEHVRDRKSHSRRRSYIRCRQCTEEFARSTVRCPRCNRTNFRSFYVFSVAVLAVLVCACIVLWAVRLAANIGNPITGIGAGRGDTSPEAVTPPDVRF